MLKLSETDQKYLQSLIDSIQYELNKSKNNGGIVCGGYITEKATKILKLVK